MDEYFSASLDNEASRDETDQTIAAVIADPEARACWTRQYWVRAALQTGAGDTQPEWDVGFADRVMAALPVDAQITADNDGRATDDMGKVTSFASRRRRRDDRNGWRTGLGAAAAASVVGIVVFAYAPMSGHDSAPGIDTGAGSTFASQPVADEGVQSASTGGALGSEHAVEASVARIESDANWSVSDPALRRELNAYLVEHHGLARNFGFSASAPSLVQSVAFSSQPSR